MAVELSVNNVIVYFIGNNMYSFECFFYPKFDNHYGVKKYSFRNDPRIHECLIFTPNVHNHKVRNINLYLKINYE